MTSGFPLRNFHLEPVPELASNGMYPCLISTDDILKGWSLVQQGIEVAWKLVENNATLLSEVLIEEVLGGSRSLHFNKTLQMAQMEVS